MLSTCHVFLQGAKLKSSLFLRLLFLGMPALQCRFRSLFGALCSWQKSPFPLPLPFVWLDFAFGFVVGVGGILCPYCSCFFFILGTWTFFFGGIYFKWSFFHSLCGNFDKNLSESKRGRKKKTWEVAPLVALVDWTLPHVKSTVWNGKSSVWNGNLISCLTNSHPFGLELVGCWKTPLNIWTSTWKHYLKKTL